MNNVDPYEIIDSILNKLNEIHESNVEKIYKTIAIILSKTVLKNYMYNAMLYEMKHFEEDNPDNVRTR